MILALWQLWQLAGITSILIIGQLLSCLLYFLYGYFAFAQLVTDTASGWNWSDNCMRNFFSPRNWRRSESHSQARLKLRLIGSRHRWPTFRQRNYSGSVNDTTWFFIMLLFLITFFSFFFFACIAISSAIADVTCVFVLVTVSSEVYLAVPSRRERSNKGSDHFLSVPWCSISPRVALAGRDVWRMFWSIGDSIAVSKEVLEL